MPRNLKISPSILSADFSRLGEEVRALCQAGADYIHVDVMDGHFVPNLTIGPCVVEQIKKHSTVPLDVHLMITHPGKYAGEFVSAGADFLTVHIEADDFTPLVIDKIRAGGAKAGIAISPGTAPQTIDELIKDVDLALIMTVEPGFANQSFLNDQLEKIRHVKGRAEQFNLLNLLIAVDGGINKHTANECIKAGANLLVSGSYIFKDKKYKEHIEILRTLEAYAKSQIK